MCSTFDPRVSKRKSYFEVSRWVVLEIRVLFLRVPYYIGNCKRYVNVENDPGRRALHEKRLKGVFT